MIFLKQLIKRIFQYEAKLILKKYHPKIIAITGSVGKTSTRDAVYAVLAKKLFVRKSEKSFTAELGVPLAIIGCPQGSGSSIQWLKNIFSGLPLLFLKRSYPEWLILEIDGDKQGDFASLSSWLHPDILIVTAIGDVPTHVENFGTIENLVIEKKILLNSIARDGVVIYNADDTHTSQLVYTSDVKKISCGTTGENVVRGFDFEILYGKGPGGIVPTGMKFDIACEDNRDTITIFNSIGIHNEYACMLAYALGIHLGMSHTDIKNSLNQFSSLPGRMKIIFGIKDTIIIDDSYNASPIAMSESLETFDTLSGTGRKIAVLGDMLELGKYSIDEHRKLAHILVHTVSYGIYVGIRSRGITEELLSLGVPENSMLTVDTAEQAGKELQKILIPGDMIFVKGSQAMRMERVVEEVMRHPQDKSKLLVRQDSEWLSRD